MMMHIIEQNHTDCF